MRAIKRYIRIDLFVICICIVCSLESIWIDEFSFLNLSPSLQEEIAER